MSTTINPWVLGRRSGDGWQVVGRFKHYTQAALHAALIAKRDGDQSTTVWYEQLDAEWFESEIARLKWEQSQWKRALKLVLAGISPIDIPGIEAGYGTDIWDCRNEILSCERQIYRIVDSAIYWGLSRGLYLIIDGDFKFHYQIDAEDDRQRGAA